jgi:RNA polymerase sigma factor (sigma-70 family)
MTPSEQQLAKAIEGDPAARDALGAWCLSHGFDLAFILLGRVANRDLLAEEIAGDASVRALASLHRFEPGTHFSAWFHTIVRNCVRDHYRQQEKSLPRRIYRRWVHDFFAAYRAELDAMIAEAPEYDAGGRLALLQRIGTDLNARTYHEFLALSYPGPADRVLGRVKEWLRTFVGLEVVSLYAVDSEGDWTESQIASEDSTEGDFMQRELVAQVNAHLAFLRPLCRRLLRWYYLEELRVPEIARLEQLSERTTYRRIESCSSLFRTRLAGDAFFSEFAGRLSSTGDATPVASPRCFPVRVRNGHSPIPAAKEAGAGKET